MRWMAIAAVGTIALGGCNEAPVATAQSTNPNVPVALLFEHEGCRVFRFSDGGRSHYYVRCANETAQTMSTQSCGKNCIRSESIQTR